MAQLIHVPKNDYHIPLALHKPFEQFLWDVYVGMQMRHSPPPIQNICMQSHVVVGAIHLYERGKFDASQAFYVAANEWESSLDQDFTGDHDGMFQDSEDYAGHVLVDIFRYFETHHLAVTVRHEAQHRWWDRILDSPVASVW